MTDLPILSIVTFLPLVGALITFLIWEDSEVARRNVRYVALFTTVVTFLVSLAIWINFDNSRSDFQLVEKVEWIEQGGISYHLGGGGITM